MNTTTVFLALVGLTPVMLASFIWLPPRRAILVTFLVGWLFCPEGGFKLSGVPDFNKALVCCVNPVLGAMLFDARRLLSFRFRAIDLPVAIFCMSPLLSSLANGLGIYDGISAVVQQTLWAGLPYYLGRVYFSDPEGLKELAIAVVIGGMIYVPFCLWEIRMSPRLHRIVYGFHPAYFGAQERYGGYRPMVFMDGGLMAALWMASAAVIAVWARGAQRQILGIPTVVTALTLAAVTVACKSLGAGLLMLYGIGTFFLVKYYKTSLPLVFLALLIPGYMVARSMNIVTSKTLISLVSRLPEERIKSFQVRVVNEDQLAAKAWQRPLLGWGRWSRARVTNEESGKDISKTDGLWIIIMGAQGLIGLTALALMLVLPGFHFARLHPARLWMHPRLAPAAGLAVVTLLYGVDCLMNAKENPVIVLIWGGLCGVTRSSFAIDSKEKGTTSRQTAIRPRAPKRSPVPLSGVRARRLSGSSRS